MVKAYDVAKRKAKFVEKYLSPLLQHARLEVKKAEYVKEENQEEFVIVTYTNNYTRKICVTGDSLRAIVIDAIRYCD